MGVIEDRSNQPHRKKLNIAICGCGNGAHACAALMCRQGHIVNIYSPLKDEIIALRKGFEDNKGLDAIIEGNESPGLQLNCITSNAAKVLPGADIIFIIVPSFAHENILQNIRKYRNPSALTVILPCRGMIELEIRESLAQTNVMVFQTLPWSCRVIQPGKLVDIKGIKKKIQAASYPANMSELFYAQMEQILDMQIERVKNMLTLTLANIGQIFHPGIMYGIMKEEPHRIFKEEEIPLFYQGVTDETAELLSGISHEIRKIAMRLKQSITELELDMILPPKQWLENAYSDVIGDPTNLRTMLNTNKAYQGIRIPTVKVGDNQYRANFKTRYITEDVPYSLLVTRTLGAMADIKTPVIDQVISVLGEWEGTDYLLDSEQALRFAMKTRLPFYYGVRTLDELAAMFANMG